MSHYFHSANIKFIHLYDGFKAILIDFDNCLANKTENTHKNMNKHTFTDTHDLIDSMHVVFYTGITYVYI